MSTKLKWMSGVGLCFATLLGAPALFAQTATPPPLTAHELLQRATPRALRGMYDNLGGDQVDGYERIHTLCQTDMDIWGTEFGFSTHPNEHVDLRNTIFPKAKGLADQGVLITLNWHQCNPVGVGVRPWTGESEPCTFTPTGVDTNGDNKPDSWTNSVVVTADSGTALTRLSGKSCLPMLPAQHALERAGGQAGRSAPAVPERERPRASAAVP